MPNFLQPMLGVPLAKLASPAGQLSIVFVHVITMLVCVGWAVGRGSDSISGEIGRGTMDLLLTLPVWRVTVMIAPAVAATVGAAVLAVSVWAGIAVGLLCVRFHDPPAIALFWPGVANLFAMTFCLTGVATLISSFNRDRWRTIALSGGFFVVSLILKIILRMWPGGWWLHYLTFLSLFQPQELILLSGESDSPAMRYDLTLLGLGVIAYVAAGVVFWRRDIPASR